MNNTELKKYLSGLNLPKKRLEIDDPVWGKVNVNWLVHNILIWNHGDIANMCYKELVKIWKERYLNE